MMKHIGMLVMMVVLVGLLLLYTVAYSIDFSQIGIITTFGAAGEPIIGSEKDEAGLRFKWPAPVERLHRYDGRIHVFDDTYKEILTGDGQAVMVTIFCGWRIRPDDAKLFYTKMGSIAKAESLLRDSLRNTKSNVIGGYPLSAMLNTNPVLMRISEIEKKVADEVQTQVGSTYGIEIVTLGVKAFGLPKDVSEKVVEVMKAEREEFAAEYLKSGEAQARLIRARAEAARTQILAFADARARAIRTEGDERAAELYATYSKNEKLAIFIKELEFLRKSMGNATIIGDGWLQHSFGFFTKGPSLPDLDESKTKPVKKD